ncbi:MAG TPA: hypothetical protein VML75_14365, partial [Kofleriaceae bacterium]|nr:hypothetical protein [Kofleriaceae bacterium]
EASTVVIITNQSIVVEGKEVVAVRDGDVDAKNKAGGISGMQIVPLTKFLQALRIENEQTLKAQGKAPPLPELMIIADRLTPYRLLLQVMYSSKVKEAGFKRFRLITLQADGAP